MLGTVVDPAGVIRAKAVPVERTAAFHRAGMGASPCWNVFCIDNAIAFTSGFGVVGDTRLRADLQGIRRIGDDIGWAPAEMFDQEGLPQSFCTRGLLRRRVTELADMGLAARVGGELEFVLTESDGSPLRINGWQAYGAGPLLAQGEFAGMLMADLDRAGLPIEQLHSEYAGAQFEISLPPTDPLHAADQITVAKLVTSRAARRAGLAASFSPQPYSDGGGNGAHLHLSLSRNGTELLAGGNRPHGLTTDGAAAIAGLVVGLPELLGVFAGSVLSGARLQPGHWSGAYACWGWENREAAVRLIAARPSNPHGASVEVKPIDPSANPYLAVATVLGMAAYGITNQFELPTEITVDPHQLDGQSPASERPPRLADDQGEMLDALEASTLAQDLIGPELLEALLAVRRHEQTEYAHTPTADVCDRFRFAWTG